MVLRVLNLSSLGVKAATALGRAVRVRKLRDVNRHLRGYCARKQVYERTLMWR